MALPQATAIDSDRGPVNLLRWRPVGLGLVWFGLVFASLTTHFPNPRGADAISYLAQVAAGAIATVWCFRNYRRFKGKQRRAWLLIAGVVAVQSAGVAVDGVVDAGMRQPLAQLSWSTITTIVSIPFAVAAAIYLLAERFELARLRTILDGVIVAVSAFFIAWASVIGGLVHNSVHNFGVDISNLAPPVANVIYMVAVVLLVLRAPRPERIGFWFFAIALACAEVADVASSYYAPAHGSSAGQWFSAFSCAAYLCIAGAAMHAAPTTLRKASDPQDDEGHGSILPYVAVGAAVCAALVTPFWGHQFDSVLAGAGILMLAALALRQSIALQENRRLAQGLRDQADILRASEARFRSLVQNSSDSIIVLDAMGLITYVSPTADLILGRPHAELMNAPLVSLVHPEDQTSIHEHLSGTDSSERGWAAIQFRTNDSSGQWRYLEVTPTNLLDDPNVRGIVLNARDVTDRRNLEEQLRHQAFHDPLTGLANRALLRDRVERALLHGRAGLSQVALLIVDLDDFKDVNDTLGHGIGDRLLAEVGSRIGGSLRSTDTAARLGGDEFAVLLEHGVNQDEAVKVANRILETIREPFEIDDTPLSVAASIGIAMGDSRHNAEDLLRRADVALYQAKNVGKGDYAIFDDSMDLMVVARLQFEVEMHRALTDDELVAFYQPIVNVTSGRIEGVEALVRWQHPTRGLLPPSEFVDLAEETGQIVALGNVMLRQACARAASWVDIDGQGPYVSVNISSKHFQSHTLVDDVSFALKTSGLPGERLVIEVTESALLANVHESMRQMDNLREMDVRIALDDFGTGYSSLGYLRELPVDILKIDRSFIIDLGVSEQPAEFLRAIYTLSSSLHLITIAEGVEEASQLGLLQELGIERIQGFLFSKPVPADALTDLLKAGAYDMTKYASPRTVAQTA
jgi:diguanylate cyclase (GGDEF)-like protein/PAS domain S-box-containing protein